MQLLSNTLAFLVALGVIIFVHEMGHLLMAKAFGVRVPVFSIGFGRALMRFRRGETEYRLAWLPVGGYVRLEDEDGSAAAEGAIGDPRAFSNRPRWQRILVYLAGPLANVVLTVLLMSAVYTIGVSTPIVPRLPAVVGEVIEGGAAAEAGLAAGDRLLAIDGEQVQRWDQVAFAFATSPGRELSVEFERDGQTHRVAVVPAPVPEYEIGDAGLVPEVQPQIAGVLDGGPAAAAGLRPGDTVRALDGRPVADRESFVRAIQSHAGQPLTLEIERNGRRRSLEVVPADEGGVGRIGVELGYFQRYGPVAAVGESLRFTWQISVQTVQSLGRILSGRIKARAALSGPIQMAAWSGRAARSGPTSLIQLMALISISIGLLNLFPIPLLDGGQIVLLGIESILRRDLPMGFKERLQQVGFLFIIGLMVLVLYFDLARTLPNLLRGSG